eukprot:Gregarina_sp_Pseudo_9__2904@NODE_3121_length_747_cov_34_807910_g2846_i0_p1_GENE_NODE_3121_length_747_cov_34_807910_g2846_i0NODE_3121_length_747_cov_34_807910_g2846_i0_p1_ORF_typecomplete_len118_score12_88_NODE_3121_length_747_cov_34_807910_g2846_i0196549
MHTSVCVTACFGGGNHRKNSSMSISIIFSLSTCSKLDSSLLEEDSSSLRRLHTRVWGAAKQLFAYLLKANQLPAPTTPIAPAEAPAMMVVLDRPLFGSLSWEELPTAGMDSTAACVS